MQQFICHFSGDSRTEVTCRLYLRLSAVSSQLGAGCCHISRPADISAAVPRLRLSTNQSRPQLLTTPSFFANDWRRCTSLVRARGRARAGGRRSLGPQVAQRGSGRPTAVSGRLTGRPTGVSQPHRRSRRLRGRAGGTFYRQLRPRLGPGSCRDNDAYISGRAGAPRDLV